MTETHIEGYAMETTDTSVILRGYDKGERVYTIGIPRFVFAAMVKLFWTEEACK